MLHLTRRFVVVAALFTTGLVAAVAAYAGAPHSSAAGPYPVRAFLPHLAGDSAGPPPPAATPTSVPTTAPTAAPPAPTPTPTAPPAPAGLSVRHQSSYVSPTGTIYVVGEVFNNLSQPAQYVEITANFFSPSGTLLATDTGFSSIDILAPGADSPFEVLLFNPPPGIDRYTVAVTDFTSPPYSGRQPVTGLSLAVSNTYVSSTGTIHVVGMVTNSSSTTYKYVEPVVALYDAAGNVVRVDNTFTKPDTLAPGQSGTFDALVFGPVTYSTYRTWVDASR